MLFYDKMARPLSSKLSQAQRRVLDAVLKRERLQLPNFVSDLVSELALKAESSLGPTLQRMARLGVILLQGGGVQGRQRLVVATPKGRLLCGVPEEPLSGESLPAEARPLLGAPLSAGKGAHARVPRHALRPPVAFMPAPRLPLLGTIPAGPLAEVIARQETAFEAVSIGDLLRHREGDFLLRITGDSMVGDGIFDGDLVLLRPGIEVQQGEIAAVIWSGSGAECEATLKRVFRKPPTRLSKGGRSGNAGASSQAEVSTTAAPSMESAPGAAPQDAQEGVRDTPPGGQILLRASNPDYPDLLLPAESVQIAGVFRGLIRQGSKPSAPVSIPGGTR